MPVEAPDPRGNFAVDLAQLEACARTSVPQIADAVTRSAGLLAVGGEPLAGVGASPATAAYARAHQQLVDVLLGRQQSAGRAIEATARALGETATVYRRADGD